MNADLLGLESPTAKSPLSSIPSISGMTQEPGPTGADSETDTDRPIIHRCVSAADARPLRTPLGPASVFDLADKPVKWRKMAQGKRDGLAHRVEISGRVTRYITFPVCETDEWKAREQARRARQKPPKPGAKIKSLLSGWGNDGKASTPEAPE